MSNEILQAVFVVISGLGVACVIWISLPRRHSSELPSKECREKHQSEYQDALDEIIALDLRITHLMNENNELKCEAEELKQSAEHWKERHDTVEEIRQKLAASLSGRCCGNQITMGNTEAKIVHGSVVVSDPDANVTRNMAIKPSGELSLPGNFICRKLGSVRLEDTLLLWNGDRRQMKDMELTDELVVMEPDGSTNHG